MTSRNRQAPQEKGAFERHAQSIVAAVILAVVLYTGGTMQDIKEQAAKTALEVNIFQKNVSEKIISLEAQMNQLQLSLQRATEDRFRGTDAASAFATRDSKSAELEARIRTLEQDHAAIKGRVK